MSRVCKSLQQPLGTIVPLNEVKSLAITAAIDACEGDDELAPRCTPRHDDPKHDGTSSQIIALLLQGCDNREIARQLHMACRTVKSHFSCLFRRYGVTSGIKRVKLATLLYRRQYDRK